MLAVEGAGASEDCLQGLQGGLEAALACSCGNAVGG
jgi:hypothetical protein